MEQKERVNSNFGSFDFTEKEQCFLQKNLENEFALAVLICAFLCFYFVAKQRMSQLGMQHVIGDTILSGPACWQQIATDE